MPSLGSTIFNPLLKRVKQAWGGGDPTYSPIEPEQVASFNVKLAPDEKTRARRARKYMMNEAVRRAMLPDRDAEMTDAVEQATAEEVQPESVYAPEEDEPSVPNPEMERAAVAEKGLNWRLKKRGELRR